MSKLTEIAEGWVNNLTPGQYLDAQILEVSKYRMSICKACPFHSKNHTSIRPDKHCTSCGCTLSAKTKCLSCSCPENKWTAVLNKEKNE
jgi:hypothetical protein